METELELYTVEYVEPYSRVVYFREVKAADFVDAKQQISTIHPDVIIRAVSRVAKPLSDNESENNAEKLE
jgi:hypothetical protein